MSEETDRQRELECGKTAWEPYMLKNEVWLSIAPSKKGYLHLRCAEKRLGRPLTLDDLNDSDINDATRYFMERR